MLFFAAMPMLAFATPFFHTMLFAARRQLMPPCLMLMRVIDATPLRYAIMLIALIGRLLRPLLTPLITLFFIRYMPPLHIR